MFLRCLLSVETGCPIPSLYWETRTSHKILQKKLLFLHHVATLPDTALAKEVYNVQTRLALPGLAQECKEFLVKFGITNVKTSTKFQWKQMVKANVSKMNKSNQRIYKTKL